MELTLIYRGLLPSNARPSVKHDIRRAFHSQLKRAWELPPLNRFHHFINRTPNRQNSRRLGSIGPTVDAYAVREMAGFKFARLISSQAGLIGKVSILMFRANPVGHLIHGGDIDNRLKTLFDALCVPPDENQLKGTAPLADESPFFCLFSDDSLIQSVSVDTSLWLESDDPKQVLLIIKCEVVVSTLGWHTIGI